MSAEPIILYDLPSQAPCKCWSLNPWKTRLLLNFKGLDYKTEWVEYPDIKPKFQDHIPLADDVGIYTIPTVRTTDGTYIMDSLKIAEYIEEKYPTPSIHLDSPYVKKVVDQISASFQFGKGVRGIFFPLVPERLLNPRSAEFWYETRAKIIGKPLSEITEDERGDKAWEYATEPVKEITRLLRENSEGPFFEGNTVTYADFYWAGYLLFWKRIGDDTFQKLLSISGDGDVHLKLLEAVKPWSERDDH
ncbi:putative glutathione S-transferase [Truncatella angustata]|uniref:Glutathione S-transferase n=1 Tax=Truncatella angustata TaxID=152316 RepID=A0A9P9A1I1_9PEZI|nr:putative glutathione S-transferase [Truncatella angustata]KAH6657020.1 putative glutathione S-transferase [Truncatella angustata]KAH8202749.1 hypothetical protein TruAng_003125 [Truncatella angustata]